MSNHELKPCPFCGTHLLPYQGLLDKHEGFVHPKRSDCLLSGLRLVRPLWIASYNQRPYEALLAGRVASVRAQCEVLQEEKDDLTAALNEAGELLDQCNGWHPNVQNAIDVIAAALSNKAEAAE